MKTIINIENHIINRLKIYCVDYQSIRGFNTNYLIHEAYKPEYLTLKYNTVLIGCKGHEISVTELDIKSLIKLFRFIVRGGN